GRGGRRIRPRNGLLSMAALRRDGFYPGRAERRQAQTSRAL
ncbi:MAG: hypothetical protein AVDCRST_MAG55-3021, partial [uncultured Rubrobacteraceae bacterium]